MSLLSTNKIQLAIPFHGLVVLVDAEGPFNAPVFTLKSTIDLDLKELEKFLREDSDFCLEVMAQFREKFLVRTMANECLLEREGM